MIKQLMEDEESKTTSESHQNFKSEKENDTKSKKKKKKRKNESSGESILPEKKMKRIDLSGNFVNKKSGKEEKEIQNNSDNEEMYDVEISKEESDKIDGKSLRQSFNSENSLKTLHKFVVICKQDNAKDLAAEYLQAGGSVIEILKLLDKSEKKNITNACTVFSAMTIVIMK